MVKIDHRWSFSIELNLMGSTWRIVFSIHGLSGHENEPENEPYIFWTYLQLTRGYDCLIWFVLYQHLIVPIHHWPT